MTSNKPKSGFYVSVTCPGCGAGLTIETNFFVLTCHYCNSVLRIRMPDLPTAWLIPGRVDEREVRFAIDRYLKENDLPLTDSNLQFKKVYYPYWKIDAFLLKVRNRTETRLVQVETEDSPEVVTESDKTDIGISPYSVTIAAGSELPGMPDSIGVRSQTITAKPFTRGNQQEGFQAMEPNRPWNEVWPRVVCAVMSVGDFDSPSFGRNRTDMLYPDYSVVYFPYFLADSFAGHEYLRFVVDGISSRIVNCYDPVNSEIDPEELQPAAYARGIASKLEVSFEKGVGGIMTRRTGKLNDINIDSDAEQFRGTSLEFGDLSIELHRCDTCGADLPDTRSPLYICRNCHELKAIGKIDFPLEEMKIAPVAPDSEDELLPFWRLTLAPDVARKLRFIFGGMYMSEAVVVPAFTGPNYDALVRLARKMSFAQTRIKFEPLEGSPRRLSPIEVSPEQAVKYMNLLLYRERLVKTSGGKVEKEEFRPTSAGILYAPFKLENYFYVDSVLESITFEKQLLQ